MAREFTVTVIGGGNGAHAAVVDQCLRGHRVRWFRRDANDLPAAGTITHDGILEVGTATPEVCTSDLGVAITGADLILAPVPADAQSGLFPTLLPLLTAGQAVAFTPGTFGTWMAARQRPDVVFLETGTLPYLCRVTRPFHVSIPVVSNHLPVGSVPGVGTQADHGHAMFSTAYPAAVRLSDGLDAALVNWGPVIHPPLVTHNLGAIESLADRFDVHAEGTSPAVRRVQQALDTERISLREHLGLAAPHWPLDEYYAGADGTMYPPDAKDRLLASDLWRESLTLGHRYLTEDVACGLVLAVTLAGLAQSDAPVGSATIKLLSLALQRDLQMEGRSVASLGIESIDHLRSHAREGFTSAGVGA